MLKYGIALACAAALLATLPAKPAHAYARDDETPEWASRLHGIGMAGVNSSAAVNALTFRHESGHFGWKWELNGSYPVSPPFFVEAGVMGWTLGRTDRPQVERFGVDASVGMHFSAGSEVGVGIMPSGGRVWVRHFFDGKRGTMAQLGLVFPSPVGTRSYLEASLGYGF